MASATVSDLTTPLSDTAAATSPRQGIGRLFRRKGRFDPQPTQPASVLLASYGGPFSKAAVAEAVRLSEGGPVAVVIIARVYGSAFGLPNPGLLPTRKEMEEQRAKVQKAVTAVERKKLECWGQVAASRRPAKTIGRVAKARGVRHVVLCTATPPGWRRVVEGDPVKEVRRRVGPGVAVTQVA
jgi:hypothetical protein